MCNEIRQHSQESLTIYNFGAIIICYFLFLVLLGKCLLGKCLSEQMSFWENVLWADVSWANVVSPLRI
jgi:hypothetical protein